MYNPPAECPLCGREGFDYSDEMAEHLLEEHEPDAMADRLAELARDLPYHRDVECQACGCCGARPGDHPLCRDCESGVSGV